MIYVGLFIEKALEYRQVGSVIINKTSDVKYPIKKFDKFSGIIVSNRKEANKIMKEINKSNSVRQGD